MGILDETSFPEHAVAISDRYRYDEEVPQMETRVAVVHERFLRGGGEWATVNNP